MPIFYIEYNAQIEWIFHCHGNNNKFPMKINTPSAKRLLAIVCVAGILCRAKVAAISKYSFRRILFISTKNEQKNMKMSICTLYTGTHVQAFAFHTPLSITSTPHACGIRISFNIPSKIARSYS